MLRTATLFLVTLWTAGCGGTELPNPAELTVTGSDGIPLFEWDGSGHERLEVHDWRSGAGEVLWEIEPVGDPPVCLNDMLGPVVWLEPPQGFEAYKAVGYPETPETLSPGEDYEASITRCESKDDDGTFVGTPSHVEFAVNDAGTISIRD